MNVYDQKGKQVHLGESVGRGGEATVYRVNGRPGQLAKIYEPAPRANYPQKLAWMLDHPPENPTQALSHPSLAWPNSLLLNTGRRLVGYQMPFIQMAVPILDVFNPRRRAEMLPKFDSRYLHRTARNLAAALNALHESGYVAGDLNESNVLVTPSALVTLIDTDSFQVEEQRDSRAILHPCPVGKLEYTPPELQNKPLGMFHRLPEQDSFGLGVLIFQLLMEGNHPFRAQWLGGGDPPPVEARIAQGAFPYTASPSYPVRPPKNAPDLNTLHPEIAELVRRCFVDGAQKPNLRPSPGMWERAIAEAEKVLVPCPRGHFYSNHLQSCPVCPPVQTRPSSAPRPAAGAGKPTQDPATRPARPPFPTGSPARNGPARNPGTAQSPTRPIPRPAANPRPAGRSPGGNPVGSRQQSGRPQPWPQPSPWVYRRPSGSALSSAWKFITTTSSLIRSIQAWQTAGAGPVQAQSRPSAQNASPSASQSGPNQGSQPGRSPHQASQGGSTGSRAWQAAPAGGGAATWSPAAPWGWPRPAPYGQVSVSRTQSQPSVSWSLVRVKIFKSLLVGGGLGALAGAVPGAVVGVASWSAGTTAALALLWALGGATAGILRGWRPGYRLSQWVSRTVGWQRVWPVAGLALGALIGTLIGLVLGWWAIFPIFLGLFLGARLGLAGGRKLWQAGNRLGWERIWAVVGAGSAALLGWVLARWVSATVLGSLDDQFAGSLASWIMGHSTSWPLVWTVVGALCGSLGGAVAGTISDLFARFSGLID